MVFYTLLYTKEGETYRVLFNSELKRSNYIIKYNITDYTLSEIDTGRINN